ncbi:MAG: hypothetical protein QM755_04955 [Luteolibacter sp.]
MAPILYGLCYFFPWEKGDRLYYGSDWWEQLWMMAKISPQRLSGLGICAAMPLQMIAAPLLVPVLRGSALLRWITRGFALLMAWSVVWLIRSSRFNMGYLEEWPLLGSGRWLEMISFCLHAAGLLVLPPFTRSDRDSAVGSR